MSTVIKCGFEIEIKDVDAFIEKVAKEYETEPEELTDDNISDFIENNIFGKYDDINPKNRIRNLALVRGLETDGGFYTMVDCDKVMDRVDELYDEKNKQDEKMTMFSKDDVKAEPNKAKGEIR